MNVVFVSNYYNHHQSEVCKEFDKQTEHDFYFIETMPIAEERLKMGWGQEQKPNYVVQSYVDDVSYSRAVQLINRADVVIFGSCPLKMVRSRLEDKKLTFSYSERIFKDKNVIGTILRAAKYRFKFKVYKKNHYLLCASGYAARDYNRIGCFVGTTFRWGYFPEVRIYDQVDRIVHSKRKNTILWAARLIDWKHPEYAIEVAKRLKRDGYQFDLNIIGNGVLEKKIKQKILKEQLQDNVHMLGAMSPEKVREHMEQCEIFLITSDQNEGWGAVLNESMNSSCAVVANGAIGSAPFLIEDGKNGLIYRNGDVDDLYEKTKWLMDHSNERKELGKNAYLTMKNVWNAENAVRRVMALANSLASGKNECLYKTGPCSVVAEFFE